MGCQRAAASRISYLVQQSIQKWLVPQENVTQVGVLASFDLLRLYLSGVPVIADTPLGAGSHSARTVAAAAEIGLAWAAPYVHPISTPARADASWSFVSETCESLHVFSLQSPPQLIKLLMDELQLPRNDKLDRNQLSLLGYISDAFPYPFAEAVSGKTFRDLMLVCQVCRHSLIAEEKGAFWTPLRVRNMWPSAVAAPAVLLDKVVFEPLQIRTDEVKRVTGSSGAPTFAAAPHEDWLGEGYATRMDTSAGSSASVDWRVCPEVHFRMVVHDIFHPPS